MLHFFLLSRLLHTTFYLSTTMLPSFMSSNPTQNSPTHSNSVPVIQIRYQFWKWNLKYPDIDFGYITQNYIIVTL